MTGVPRHPGRALRRRPAAAEAKAAPGPAAASGQAAAARHPAPGHPLPAAPSQVPRCAPHDPQGGPVTPPGDPLSAFTAPVAAELTHGGGARCCRRRCGNSNTTRARSVGVSLRPPRGMQVAPLLQASSSPLCLIPLLVLFYALDLDLLLTLGLALALPGAQQSPPGASCGWSLPVRLCPCHSMQRATGDFRKMQQQSLSSSRPPVVALQQCFGAALRCGHCQCLSAAGEGPGQATPRRLLVGSHSSQSLEK